MSGRWVKREARRIRRAHSKAWCLVYVLREAPGKPPRYVGQTRTLPENRLWWHFKGARQAREQGKRLTAAQRWIDGLVTAGTPPIIEVIDKNGIWDISEAVWIDRLRQAGADLLNHSALVAIQGGAAAVL